jgi:hypothetical protein
LLFGASLGASLSGYPFRVIALLYKKIPFRGGRGFSALKIINELLLNNISF